MWPCDWTSCPSCTRSCTSFGKVSATRPWTKNVALTPNSLEDLEDPVDVPNHAFGDRRLVVDARLVPILDVDRERSGRPRLVRSDGKLEHSRFDLRGRRRPSSRRRSDHGECEEDEVIGLLIVYESMTRPEGAAEVLMRRGRTADRLDPELFRGHVDSEVLEMEGAECCLRVFPTGPRLEIGPATARSDVHDVVDREKPLVVV